MIGTMRIGVGVLLAFVASTTAHAADDPDGCALARAPDVAALITTRPDVDMSAASGHPAAGESTCTWTARERGRTADAPSAGSLSLAFYHMADRARAVHEMRGLADAPSPPSLVKTADADDAIRRTDTTIVAARHGQDMVVVDASATDDDSRERADWAYRLEALALGAAGARVLGPIDARAKASVCTLVDPARVLALLTLSPSTLAWDDDPADDGRRCRFNVKDGSRKSDGWIENQDDAQVTREDLGTHAAALARLKNDMPFDPPSLAVPTRDADDRIVPRHDRPEEVEAVHGPYLVTLTLNNVTAAARAHPTWGPRVMRTALEIAGATIVPPPGQPPDPVTPGPVPPPTAFAWTTSGHVPPAWAQLAEPFAHGIAFMARWRFPLMPLLIVAPPILFGLFGRAKPRRARSFALVPLLIAIGVINLVFGPSISVALIHAIGIEAQATITAGHATSTVYNNRPVRRYDVLVRTPRGVAETSFETDDFNVYPSHNGTIYPSIGDAFNVRYLPDHPGDLVILADGASPWAHGLRCDRLAATRFEAQSKARFAPENAAYRAALEAAVSAEASGGCGD